MSDSAQTTVVMDQRSISLEAATGLVEAAARQSAARGKAMSIAIVDAAGHLKAYARMDGAPLLAAEIAQNKAYTAAAFGMPTDAWYDFIKEDPPLLVGIVQTPRLVVYGGGVPVVVDGEVVAGLGISGGHYSEDMAVAAAALEECGLTS
jgi:uncharacterized protein GlcG (DUF336 family)